MFSHGDFSPYTRHRHWLGTTMDAVFFPVRALFMGPTSCLGLSSMMDERMRRVANLCRGRVLDVGCGPHNIFISRYIGTENGVGVDVYAYDGVEHVIDDAARLPFPDHSFDTVTLIAVGGHIPKNKRVAEFAEFARVLRPGGRLIMTEGEPITQWLLHAWLRLYLGLRGMKDVDSERGMDEEEEYCMPREELLALVNQAPLRLVRHERFQWRLNNVYMAEKQA